MQIAICLPSRGLVFSRTVESIIGGIHAMEKEGVRTTYHASHDKPIPKSHNYVVKDALKTDADKILMMEEDNFLYPQAFLELISSDFDIFTVQYNDKNGSPHGIIHYNEAQEVLWAGLGSVVIKREVFEKMGEPYFRTDTRYENVRKRRAKDGKLITKYKKIENRQVWSEEDNDFVEKKDHYKYGGLDIDFYTRAREHGFSIGVCKNHKGHHFKLVQLGEEHNNNGCHVIRQV